MALPNSGALSLNQIHVEAGGSSGTQASINDSDIRGLIGKSSGAQMSFNEWYGATNTVTVSQTISSSTNNYNIASSRPGTYSAGNTQFTLTVNPGVTVGSNSTSGTSLTMGSPWSSGDAVTINNYGTIKGAGGNGGTGAHSDTGSAGNNATAGGTVNGAALTLTYPVTVGNYGSIYGGVGGGGGCGTRNLRAVFGKLTSANHYQGGGGGGGAGVNSGSGGAFGPTSGSPFAGNMGPGDPGSAGTANAGGAGGISRGTMLTSVVNTTDTGGAGGGLGANGATGGMTPFPSPSSLPFGAVTNYSSTNQRPAGAGGTRGYYISGNPYATWSPQGTVGGRST